MRTSGMSAVAVEFPELLHYIAARSRTLRTEPPVKPAEHLTAHKPEFPQKARHVHEA